MHADSFLLLNRGDIYRLKSLIKKGRINNAEIIAKDSVISYFLDQEGIQHRTVSELVTKDSFQSLTKKSLEETFSLVRKLALRLQESSQEIQTFFDCYSWEVSKKLFSLIFYLCIGLINFIKYVSDSIFSQI